MAQERLRPPVVGPKESHVLGLVPFGEALSRRGHEQGNVEKFRGRITKQFIEIELPGRGIQQIASAHHLGNPHFPIIGHHCQLISKHPVRAPDDKIPAVPEKVFPEFPLTAIGKGDFPVGHHQAVSRAAALGQPGPLFFR